MVGLRGNPSFFFFFFFSPFSFPESSPGVSPVFTFLLGLPSGEVKLLRFVDGFPAKNCRQRKGVSTQEKKLLLNIKKQCLGKKNIYLYALNFFLFFYNCHT